MEGQKAHTAELAVLQNELEETKAKQCQECSSHLHKIAELREEGVELREEHLKKISELRDEVSDLRNQSEETTATQARFIPVSECCQECSLHLHQIAELREEIVKLRDELEETKAKTGPLIEGLKECASHVEKMEELRGEVAIELQSEIEASSVERVEPSGRASCQGCASAKVKIAELQADLASRAPSWKSPRTGATPTVRRSFSGGINTRTVSSGEKSGSPVGRNVEAAVTSKGRGRGRSVPQRAAGVNSPNAGGLRVAKAPSMKAATPVKEAQIAQNSGIVGLPLVQCAVVEQHQSPLPTSGTVASVNEIPAPPPPTPAVSSPQPIPVSPSAVRYRSPGDVGLSVSTSPKRPGSPLHQSPSGSLSPKFAPSCWPQQSNPPCSTSVVPTTKKLPASPSPRSVSPPSPPTPGETGPQISPARSASPSSRQGTSSNAAVSRSPPHSKSPPHAIFEAGLIAIKTPRRFAVSRSPPRSTDKTVSASATSPGSAINGGMTAMCVPRHGPSPQSPPELPNVKEITVETSSQVTSAPPSPPFRGVTPASGTSAVIPSRVVPIELAPGRRSLSPAMVPAVGVPTRGPGEVAAAPGCFWQPPANLFAGPLSHCTLAPSAPAGCNGAAPPRAGPDRSGIGQNLNSHLAAALQRAATAAAVGSGGVFQGHQSRGGSIPRQEQTVMC